MVDIASHQPKAERCSDDSEDEEQTIHREEVKEASRLITPTVPILRPGVMQVERDTVYLPNCFHSCRC